MRTKNTIIHTVAIVTAQCMKTVKIIYVQDSTVFKNMQEVHVTVL